MSGGHRVYTSVDAYLDFRCDLRAALRELSPTALRDVLRRWTEPSDMTYRRLASLPDRAHEPVIRTMILAEPRLAEMHGEARLWLARHHLSAPAPADRPIAPTDRRCRRPGRTAEPVPA